MKDQTPTMPIPEAKPRLKPQKHPEQPPIRVDTGEPAPDWYAPAVGFDPTLRGMLTGLLTGLGLMSWPAGWPLPFMILWTVFCWLAAVFAWRDPLRLCRPQLPGIVEAHWPIRVMRIQWEGDDRYRIRWLDPNGSMREGMILDYWGRVWLLDEQGRPIHASA